MSLSEGPWRSTVLSFFMQRVKRDLQFSNIFLVDFVVSLVYAGATVAFLNRDALSARWATAAMILAIAYAALHIGKIMLIIELERRGGDARQFVGSEQLVTSGVYAWSRNPVYLISLLQSALWSLGLVFLCVEGRDFSWAIAVATLLLYAHYWGQDRLIIPNEEAALMKRHPVDFPAYCARVQRWFGRKA